MVKVVVISSSEFKSRDGKECNIVLEKAFINNLVQHVETVKRSSAKDVTRLQPIAIFSETPNAPEDAVTDCCCCCCNSCSQDGNLSRICMLTLCLRPPFF